MRSDRWKEIAQRLEGWFARNQRDLPWRARYDPYEIWLSEVMLQQTRMEVVLVYYDRFLARFPNLEALAQAAEEDVLAAWSGLGYYRRARALREAARMVIERHDGVMPDAVELLRELPGIGRYTAGAVASIAHQRRTPVVEGNVTRLLARIDALEAPAGSAVLTRQLWDRATRLVERAESPRNLNQAMMELGALVCRPATPSCNECPVEDLCSARIAGRTGELPRAGKRSQSEALTIPLFIVEDARGNLLMRRERGALMTGMLHFPHGSDALLDDCSESFAAGELIGSVRHTVTHRRIEFRVVAAQPRGAYLRETPGDYVWIDPGDIERFPHPSYVRKVLGLLESRRQKAEGRRQKAEGRRQKAEG
ncbi:MAG TPA: A/G-specific adenine glycosylase [Thermoanaerobaculia bacterium]|nr:A/G-specific adenine glycosylase [Thermoanaerobaculia bacterium]